MNTEEHRGPGAGREHRESGLSLPGPLAAAIDFRKVPTIQFAPFRGDDPSLEIGLCAWIALSLLADLTFF